MANTVSHLKHDEGWVLKVLKCDLNFCFTFMCAFYFEFFFMISCLCLIQV